MTLPPTPARLAGMMLLFYFALGAFSVTLPTYLMSAPEQGGLGLSSTQAGGVSSASAVAGMLSLVVVGLLIDRLFRAERVLAVACLTSAAFLALAAAWCADRATQAAPDAAFRDATFRGMLVLAFSYQFGLQLGLTITTVIALRNLPDPVRQFSRTRMWGTVGWIAAGNAVGLVLVGVSAQPLYLGAAFAALLALYTLALPPTPPTGQAKSLAQAFGLPAWGLFADRTFAAFAAVTVLATMMNRFYELFVHRYLKELGLERPEQSLTLGQACEVGCLFLVPLLHPRRRMKLLMVVGLGGWILRAAVLRAGDVDVIRFVGVPMHGWSFAFFHVVGLTYLDQQAPPHLRGSAQAMLTFITAGVGVLFGNLLAGRVVDAFTAPATGAVDWPNVWLVPLVGCTLALALFVALFRTPRPVAAAPPLVLPTPEE